MVESNPASVQLLAATVTERGAPSTGHPVHILCTAERPCAKPGLGEFAEGRRPDPLGASGHRARTFVKLA